MSECGVPVLDLWDTILEPDVRLTLLEDKQTTATKSGRVSSRSSSISSACMGSTSARYTKDYSVASSTWRTATRGGWQRTFSPNISLALMLGDTLFDVLGFDMLTTPGTCRSASSHAFVLGDPCV